VAYGTDDDDDDDDEQDDDPSSCFTKTAPFLLLCNMYNAGGCSNELRDPEFRRKGLFVAHYHCHL